jgi:ribosomal protein S18 acetylase RimI-like enzyme
VTRVSTAGLEDLEVLTLLFDAYRVFYKRESDLEGAEMYLRARLERSEATVFLARDGERALGFALCYSTFTSVAMKPLVILNDLYVSPEARGQGVATALIGACTAFARLKGAVILRLRTAHDNETARRVYERAGFKRDSVYYTYDLSL